MRILTNPMLLLFLLLIAYYSATFELASGSQSLEFTALVESADPTDQLDADRTRSLPRETLRSSSASFSSPGGRIQARAGGGGEGEEEYTEPDASLGFGISSLNPMSTVARFVPGTYKGLSSDLSNTFGALSGGLSQGYNGLQGQYSSMSDGASRQMNKFQQQLWKRLTSNEELLERLYEMVTNPQEMCRRLAQQAQRQYAATNQQVEEAQRSAQQAGNSIFSKLGGGFSSGFTGGLFGSKK